MNEHQSRNSQHLRSQPTQGFTAGFTEVVGRLGLQDWLSENELELLCAASFYAALCNIAFNGLGGCAGQIRPERELNRIALEQEFMAAREQFWTLDAVVALPTSLKSRVCRILLNVSIAEENLAGGETYLP